MGYVNVLNQPDFFAHAAWFHSQSSGRDDLLDQHQVARRLSDGLLLHAVHKQNYLVCSHAF